jgi:hypothetical protein
MVSGGNGQVVITGAGAVVLSADTRMALDLSPVCGLSTLNEIARSDIRFEICLRPLGTGLPVVLQGNMKAQPIQQTSSDRLFWELEQKGA